MLRRMSKVASTLSEQDLIKARARSKVLARADRDMKDALIGARRERGLTQADIAELLGVSPQAIQKFERYDNDPKLSTLRRYANAVGVIVEHRVTTDVGQSLVMAGRTTWSSGTQVKVAASLLPGTTGRDGSWSDAKRSSFAIAA